MGKRKSEHEDTSTTSPAEDGAPDELFGDDDDEEDDQDVWTFHYRRPNKRHPYSYKGKIPDSLIKDDGKGITVFHKDMECHFFKWYFGDRLIINEISLLGNKIPDLETMKEIQGRTFSLLASKLVKKRKSKSSTYDVNIAKTYYVANHSKYELKEELEKLGNFQGMEACKVAARMELAISPVTKLYDSPLQFQLDPSMFQLIDENGNEGCGFIPLQLLIHLLGPNKGRNVYAIQVRVFSPVIGWAKGMLVRKTGISRIQLPPTMIKVKKSEAKQVKKWVYFGILQCFPSEACKMTERSFNPHLKEPAPSYLAKGTQKNMKPAYRLILSRCGVSEEMLDNYAANSTQWEGRDHCGCVGVADPTASIPSGKVFLSGFGVVRGKESTGVHSQIFVTRFPCLSSQDGVLLDCIHGRPATMDKTSWDYLASLPFGMLVFPCKGGVPKRIADGDLDGDIYQVCWNLGIVKQIHCFKQYSDPPGKVESDTTDPLLGVHLSIEGKDAVVIQRGQDGRYIAAKGTELTSLSTEEFLQGREFVQHILDHRDMRNETQVLIGWASGIESWESLADLRNEIPQDLADYALANGILHQKAWTWCDSYIGDAVALQIQDHRVQQEKVQVLTQWAHGASTWDPINLIPEESIPLLVEYASSKSLLNKKGWETVRRYKRNQESQWFENAQKKMCTMQLLRDQDRITSQLHSLHEKAFRNDLDSTICNEISQAYKDSIDIRKHGGKLTLRPELLSLLREKALHKYFI